VRSHFVTFIEENLVAEADTEQRLSGAGLLTNQIGQGSDFLHRVAAGADAREDEAGSFLDFFGFATDSDVGADVPKRVCDASHVAYAVINNHQHC